MYMYVCVNIHVHAVYLSVCVCVWIYHACGIHVSRQTHPCSFSTHTKCTLQFSEYVHTHTHTHTHTYTKRMHASCKHIHAHKRCNNTHRPIERIYIHTRARAHTHTHTHMHTFTVKRMDPIKRRESEPISVSAIRPHSNCMYVCTYVGVCVCMNKCVRQTGGMHTRDGQTDENAGTSATKSCACMCTHVYSRILVRARKYVHAPIYANIMWCGRNSRIC
jgi:hypothetical protein